MDIDADQKKFIDIATLANILCVPKSWIYERTRLNRIPHYKFGKYVRFVLAEVLAVLEKEDGCVHDPSR